MSGSPDLSLPAKAPSMARYHDQPMTLHPTALYTLLDLTDAELADLARECETGCVDTGSEPGQCVRPAPQPRFVGQPLRAVLDYHLELGTQDTFEPRYFIAAVEKSWQTRGVILVTLDDDELDCNVDSFRIKAVDSGLTVANLQIANSSWDEEKESYEFHPSDEEGVEHDDDDDNGDDNNNNDDEDDDGDDDDDDGPPAPSKNVPLGYYIPIYIHSHLSEDKVIASVEPSLQHKSPENIACRVQAKLTPSSHASSDVETATKNLIKQAVSLHPVRCVKNKYLHKTYILVIDTADPAENGMLMVKLPPWDAQGDGGTAVKTKADARRIGKELALATPSSIRIPYACYEGLQTRFLTLANGAANWPSDDVRAGPRFVVFQYNTHRKEFGFGSNWLDPRAAKRKPGEERLAYAPSLIKRPGKGLENISWNYDEAVRRFPWFCAQRRFVEGLDTTFFICVDGNDVEQTGVLLVRRAWDGNVWGRKREELLGLPVEGVRNVRVPIREALAVLEKGRKGEIDGMDDGLKEFFS
ncbi:hypothetical protein F5B17DRAFT_449499 [Nemania serpens]|nr:hypothetical protein F5B17DRAFT_449499 [Nemania serpens]